MSAKSPPPAAPLLSPLPAEVVEVLASVIAAIPAALFVQRDGRIIYANEQAGELTGYAVDDLRGMEFRSLLHPEMRATSQIWGLARDLGRPNTSRYEARILRRDGRSVWLDYLTCPIRFLGEPAILGVASDMTERKLTADRLRESERALSTLLSNLPGMAYRCRNDPDWTMEFVSEGCAELTGYRTEQLIENQLVAYNDLIHPDDQDLVWNAVQAGVTAHGPFRMVYRIRDANGQEKVVWEQGRGVFDASGQLTALEGFITDITDWHRAEQKLKEAHEHLELRVAERTRDLTDSNRQLQRAIQERVQAVSALDESERRIQAIVDNSPAVIYAKDAQGRYILTNRVFEQMFHWTREQIVGHTDAELFTPEYAAGFQANDRLVRESAKPLEFEENVPQDDGEHIYISVKFPMFDADGQVYAVCGVSTDITEKKRAEAELKRAKAAAEAASQAKSRFLANISHEIRTPITAMLGSAELLNRLSPGDVPRHLDTIVRNGQYLLALIDDLLDAARLEAGKLRVRIAEAALPALVADCQSIVESLGRSPGVRFGVEFASAVPAVVHTDATRLKQALVNLLNNAFKFTHAGHVVLRVSAEKNGSTAAVRFDVEDTGTGIHASKLDRIFEAFEQLDRQPIAGKVGAGLGLALTRWIAEQLGGELRVASIEGKGSTFTLIISAGPPELITWLSADAATLQLQRSGARPAPDHRSLRGKVLIADDFPDTLELLGVALRGAGADVVLAADGEEAVREASAQSFDLILMDIRMPGMGGLAAARELRRSGCLTPIIALTASVSGTEQDRIIEAGFDDFWSKPIPLDSLIERSAAFLASDTAAPVVPTAPSDGQVAALADVRRRYADELRARIALLEDAIARGDVAKARDILHQLVGTSGIVGFPQISEAAAPMHAAVKQGSLKAAADGMSDLKARITEAQAQVAQERGR